MTAFMITLIMIFSPMTATATPTTITVLSIGDSLTFGTAGTVNDSYRAELSRLMNQTGQPHVWKMASFPGTKCSTWAGLINDVLTENKPDLIFLNCGTNDRPGDNTEQDYRTILSAATSRGVQVVAALIGVPNVCTIVGLARIAEMRAINVQIQAALADYPQVAYADFDRVPDNAKWMVWDFIHLLPRAEAAYGQLFYEAAQPIRGWRTLAQMGEMGVRPSPEILRYVC